MKFVNIYKTKNDGSQEIILTCECEAENDNVACKGDEAFKEELEQEGIYNYSGKDPEKLFFKDGFKFLKNLRFAFKSGYLNASDAEEKKG